MKPVLAKIYDYHPNYDWIVSELVRPIKNMEELDNYTNHQASSDLHRIEVLKSVWMPAMMKKRFGKMLSNEEEKQVRQEWVEGLSEFGKVVYDLVQNNNLVIGDLKKPDSWGKTSDNRLVLLDYGLTDEVWDKHYEKNRR